MDRLSTDNLSAEIKRFSRGRRKTATTISDFVVDSNGDTLEDIINVRVSDAKFRDLKGSTPIGRRCKQFFGIQEPMTRYEFHEQLRRLYKCCLKGVKDLHELHLRRSLGLDILEDIISRVNPEYIMVSHVIHLIWCIMSCIHHFQLRLKTSETGVISWSRRKKSEHCLKVYRRLIRIIDKDMYRIAVGAIVTFYREGRLWEIEFGCTVLIVEILENHVDMKEDLDDILHTIEVATIENGEEAKYLTKVLCEIMKNIKWKKMTMYLIAKILTMIESSIKPNPNDTFNYIYVRKGFELCVKNAVRNLHSKDLIRVLFILMNRINSNVHDKDSIVCFGNIAIFTAQIYSYRAGDISFSEGPLPIIISLFKSTSAIVVLFGLKIAQKILDRQQNGENFLSPKIFFQDCDYFLKIRSCRQQDKNLFKRMRRLIYQIIMNSFLVSVGKTQLENVYRTVALLIIEIPCGYSASCIVTMAMSIQEYAFKITSKDLVRSHHLHATVLALLTLICYTHNAKIFYQYVRTIIERRAELAPHLNPPLKTQYEYSQHHILWNKPDLFFEDWEARYGLWKCFRGKRRFKQYLQDRLP
ncbi:uncharacterized protein LOC114330242 [Diabrotica virgifera virgifera]|uniref:Uncharacterized protein LOC114330242 n=1 Tax=Diabrotica virgifera virgifera TaxID=50390 RepID=A0A6P7FHK6_DIAVI|nr:uncharacterized protein LOC114330242 [Diabrotica virgifera virgifera]